MMATVPHVTSGSGLRTFQADGFYSTELTTIHFILKQEDLKQDKKQN